MKAIQNRCSLNDGVSTFESFDQNDTQNEISSYYIDEARDWCLHSFSSEAFETVLFFFQFLNGKSKFTYAEFKAAYGEYIQQVSDKNMELFDEILDMDEFLQLLFELNMICYYDKTADGKSFFRFCYREREIYQLEPKVKIEVDYGVHYALLKALNLGRNSRPYLDN